MTIMTIIMRGSNMERVGGWFTSLSESLEPDGVMHVRPCSIHESRKRGRALWYVAPSLSSATHLATNGKKLVLGRATYLGTAASCGAECERVGRGRRTFLWLTNAIAHFPQSMPLASPCRFASIFSMLPPEMAKLNPSLAATALLYSSCVWFVGERL